MKTIFAQPSDTYTIELNKDDFVKLMTGGVLYMPTRTPNKYAYAGGKVGNIDGHFLQYHGPEDGTIPVQFVCIRLEQ